MEVKVKDGRLPAMSFEFLCEFCDKKPSEVLFRTLYTGGEGWSHVVRVEGQKFDISFSLALLKHRLCSSRNIMMMGEADHGLCFIASAISSHVLV